MASFEKERDRLDTQMNNAAARARFPPRHHTANSPDQPLSLR
jgi:hypothetical protein